MISRRLLVPSIVAVATAAGAACSEIGTNPSAPVSIRFDTLPALAIVEKDTLRDSLGVPARITATALNAAGDTIHGAAFTFLARDTTNALIVDPAGGFVIARDSTARSTDVTLQASLGGLQFTRTLAIVPVPDSLGGPAAAVAPALILAPDTAALRRKNLSQPFSARVFHMATPVVPVRAWRVDFGVVDTFPTSLLDSARIVDANGAFVRSATTGSDGVATAYLRFYPKSGLANGLTSGSVTVVASAIRKKGEAIDSAVSIVVPFALCSGPTAGCATRATVVAH